MDRADAVTASGRFARFKGDVWLRAAILLTLLVVAFAVYVRFTGLADVFCHSPDELGEIMPGLRLHALPIANLGAPIRYNFARSMFYSQHGLGDVSFYYLASGALSLAGLPVSERWLYVAGGLTNLGLAIAGCALAATLLESMATGWILALLILVSPFYVFVSKTGWARLSWTPLLLVLALLCQQQAIGRRGFLWPLAFWCLAGFTALTDAFVMLPILPLAALWSVSGSLKERGRRVVHDRVFLIGMLAIGLGVAIDVLLGLGARRRGTDLTMIGYMLLRGAHGAIVPTRSVLRAWAVCVDAYLPFRGAWVLVVIGFIVAVRDAVRGRTIGAVAAWWLIASFGVFRYAAALQSTDPSAVPGWLNTYYLAPPSLLLVARLIARILGEPISMAAMRTPLDVASRGRRPLAAAALLTLLVVPMAVQAHAVAFADVPRYGLRADHLVRHTEVALSVCRTIKAAAFYIRSHQTALPYVFHLSSDAANVYLGHIAEFYDGLSYSRSSRPEEPNHLLDFGVHHYGRNVPPEALYRPYGVTHFDYYVDFVDDRDRAHFKPAVVARLTRDGARVVCTIWDGGRRIGRVLSFSSDRAVDLDYREAAAAWDRDFGRARTLLQQPIAGTAYHFGYNWRNPE